MNKSEFLACLSIFLKEKGFKKKGVYWYKYIADLIICVNLQSSQWDTSTYYVNIGFADNSIGKSTPSIGYWFAQHRCIGKRGDKNLDFEEFISEFSIIDNNYSSKSEANTFLNERTICHVNFGKTIIF